jgi:hypothetical protein
MSIVGYSGTHRNKTAFPKLDSDTSIVVLSFLNSREIAHFLSTSTAAQKLKEKQNNVLERLIFSQVPIFGREQYQYYWGVEITNEFDAKNIHIRVLRAFLKVYYGPNPVYPKKRVKDTCLIPTVVPERVQVAGRVFEFNLRLLGQLAEYPGGRGYLANYGYASPSLGEHGTVKAECANLVLLLQGVVGRNKRWSRESANPNERGQVQVLQDLNARTEYGCEPEPDALSQNTVAFAHHADTNDRPFGDRTGMEGRYTCACTRELVRIGDEEENVYQMVSGAFRAGAVGPLGDSAPAGLRIHHAIFEDECDGVGVMRKFF